MNNPVKQAFPGRLTGHRLLILGAGLVAFTAGALAALGGDAPGLATNALAFRASSDGGFEFDTGGLRGRLRAGGKSLGLTAVVHAPSGAPLDRSNGLFSHYRVFTRGKRYGGGAWDWPSTARLLPNGAVAVRWPAVEGRPFELSAVYQWRRADTLDLTTTVTAQADLLGFESFLASYFSEAFTNALVCARGDADSGGQPVFRPAVKSAGDWQMFTRDEDARTFASDGRWKLEPNPVDWAMMPVLAKPLGLRRAPGTGMAVALMALPGDCFAIATPHEGEGHYSMYLSLFGRDIKAGQSLQARTRLVLLSGDVERAAVAAYERFGSGRARP
jgi:hypothetical protein